MSFIIFYSATRQKQFPLCFFITLLHYTRRIYKWIHALSRIYSLSLAHKTYVVYGKGGVRCKCNNNNNPNAL